MRISFTVFIFAAAAVSHGGCTPVDSSAPGIEILPAAFSDTDQPKYVVVGNSETASRNDLTEKIVTRIQSQPKIQETRPAAISVHQYQQPQTNYQPQASYQDRSIYQQQRIYQQPVEYQQYPYYQQQPVYAQPQPVYQQQSAYQQQPVYAPTPYTQPSSAQYYRPDSRPMSPGFLDTVAMAFGIRTGNNSPFQGLRVPTSPLSLTSLLGGALLLG